MINKPLKRLEHKITIDNLWLYILSLLKKEDLYAYEINKKLDGKFGFSAGQVTAYVVLYKLEKTGYVKAEWKKEARKRKYYKITDKGLDLLDEGIKLLENKIKDLKRRV